ncbi:LysR substrate-binding domain-containing protein [Streptomyces halstedii]|uniref:LysR substrate-binding domain-containing protein n=1 Tax=Streptomyces halstedii TaxID=1944 RepID=UPI003807C392
MLDLFLARHPHARLRHREIQPASPLDLLMSGDVDVVYVWLPVDEPGLTVLPTARTSALLLMGSPRPPPTPTSSWPSPAHSSSPFLRINHWPTTRTPGSAISIGAGPHRPAPVSSQGAGSSAGSATSRCASPPPRPLPVDDLGYAARPGPWRSGGGPGRRRRWPCW